MLFLAVAIPQGRFALLTLRLIEDPQAIPRMPTYLDADTLRMKGVSRAARAAGARDGDLLLAVDGLLIRAMLDAPRIFFSHKPGDTIRLTVSRNGGARFNVAFVMPTRETEQAPDLVLLVFLNIVTPWCCIVLGFFTAFRRTGDPVAYSLLFLLLCVSQLLQAEAAPRWGWSPLYTWTFFFLNVMGTQGLGPAWFFFTSLFPDPGSPPQDLAAHWRDSLIGLSGRIHFERDLFGDFGQLARRAEMAAAGWPSSVRPGDSGCGQSGDSGIC